MAEQPYRAGMGRRSFPLTSRARRAHRSEPVPYHVRSHGTERPPYHETQTIEGCVTSTSLERLLPRLCRRQQPCRSPTPFSHPAREELDQLRHDARPSRLMTGAQARAVVPVGALIEEDVIAPARVGLECLRTAVDRALARSSRRTMRVRRQTMLRELRHERALRAGCARPSRGHRNARRQFAVRPPR